MPTWPARRTSASRCACHTVSGTMILPAGTSTASGVSPSSRRRTVQSSATTSRPLMICSWCCSLGIFVFSDRQFACRDRRGIHMFLEWRNAEALGDVDEAFALDALAQVDVEQALDDFRH